jgi:hypothetical protein
LEKEEEKNCELKKYTDISKLHTALFDKLLPAFIAFIELKRSSIGQFL